MGPEPMMSILCRSSRLGTGVTPLGQHVADEITEEVEGIVRARRDLGVELHRVGGVAAVAEALEGAVVEVDEGRLGLLRDGPQVHAEAVVLGGDDYVPVAQVLHRLVGAAVPELELEVLPPRARPSIWCPRQMPKMGFTPTSLDISSMR